MSDAASIRARIIALISDCDELQLTHIEESIQALLSSESDTGESGDEESEEWEDEESDGGAGEVDDS